VADTEQTFHVVVVADGHEVSWSEKEGFPTYESAWTYATVLFGEYADRARYPTLYKICPHCGKELPQPDRIDVTINGEIVWNWVRDRDLANLPENVEPFIPGIGVIHRHPKE
jgi:hypothetical protein